MKHTLPHKHLKNIAKCRYSHNFINSNQFATRIAFFGSL